MVTPANMYAATHCMVPIFKWEDRKWHVDYTENEKWVDKSFQDPELAYKFYLEIFHKLENGYNAKTKEGKGSR